MYSYCNVDICYNMCCVFCNSGIIVYESGQVYISLFRGQTTTDLAVTPFRRVTASLRY